MKNQTWIKGATLLALSFFISVLLVKPVGVSTQFSVLSGVVHSSIDKNVITEDASRESGYKSTNAYYDKSEGKLAEEIKNPINYEMVFVLAIPLGAFIAHKTTKRSREEINEINNECKIESQKGFISKYLPSFIGGFLLLYGARFAGGCTSGHMMSGMMQSSVSGYVFAGVVFAVAIPTALIVKKMKHN